MVDRGTLTLVELKDHVHGWANQVDAGSPRSALLRRRPPRPPAPTATPGSAGAPVDRDGRRSPHLGGAPALESRADQMLEREPGCRRSAATSAAPCRIRPRRPRRDPPHRQRVAKAAPFHLFGEAGGSSSAAKSTASRPRRSIRRLGLAHTAASRPAWISGAERSSTTTASKRSPPHTRRLPPTAAAASTTAPPSSSASATCWRWSCEPGKRLTRAASTTRPSSTPATRSSSQGTVPYLEEGICGRGNRAGRPPGTDACELVREASARPGRGGVLADERRRPQPGRLIPAWRDFLLTCDLSGASAASGEPVSAGTQRGRGGRVRAARAALQPRLRRGAAIDRDVPIRHRRASGTRSCRGPSAAIPSAPARTGKAVSSRYSLDSPLEGTLCDRPAAPSVTLNFAKVTWRSVRHFVAQCARYRRARHPQQRGPRPRGLRGGDQQHPARRRQGQPPHLGRGRGAGLRRPRRRPDRRPAGRARAAAAEQDRGRGLWIAQPALRPGPGPLRRGGTDVRLRMRLDG